MKKTVSAWHDNWFLKCAMGMQILLGLAFAVTACVNMVAGFVTGKGAWFIRVSLLVNVLPEGLRLPVCLLLVLAQLAVGFLTAFFLVDAMELHSGDSIGAKVFAALYLLTIPFCMQVHMTPGTKSVLLSLLVLQITLALRVRKEKSKRIVWEQIGIWITWVVMTMLANEYLLIGMVVPLWTMITECKRKKYVSMAVLGFVGGALISFAAGCIHISENRIVFENRYLTEFLAMLMRRFAWRLFVKNYYFTPWDMRDIFPLELAAWVDSNVHGIEDVLLPAMYAKFGVLKTVRYCFRFAYYGLTVWTKTSAGNLALDAVANFFPAVGTVLHMAGTMPSADGINLAEMNAMAGVLAKGYMRFYIVLTVVTVPVSMIICGVKKKRTFGRMAGMLIAVSAVTAVLGTLAGTFQADYTSVCIVSMLWGCLPLYALQQKAGKDCE